MTVLKGIYCGGAIALLAAFPLAPFPARAQTPPDPDAAYARVADQRAEKIVATLGIGNAARAERVRGIIARQYRDLREIHAARDARLKDAKDAQPGRQPDAATPDAIRDDAERRLDTLHHAYLARLAAELTPEQVDQVKDGMTYGVLQVTYRAYQKLLPDLTTAQKAQILAWLKEARERAMDGGTSEEKHAWFGKYKGRINNYLSAAGYDLKKAERALAESRRRRPE